MGGYSSPGRGRRSAAPAPMTDSSPEQIEPPPWVRWSLRAVVVLPFVLAAARAVVTGWFPVGDGALLAIRAQDVGTLHHPWLGSWTSASLTLGVDVNNPGPLYPDLLAPFMWTLGRWFGIGAGVAVGVAGINAGFAMATAWVGSRLGGWRVERWALLMCAGLAWSMGSQLLIDIWQPHALLLPFTCLLMLTVGLVSGHWMLLPGWFAVASLIVQTHIGYVYVIAVLSVVVLVAGALAFRESDRTLRDLTGARTTWWSVAVLVLAWSQPIIEQIAGEGEGNLSRLARNAGGGDVTIGAGASVKLVAQVVVLPPWWTRFGFEDSVVSTPLTPSPDGPRLLIPDLPSGPLALVAVAAVVTLLAWLTIALRARHVRTAAAATLISLIGVTTALVTLTIQTVSVVGLGSHHVRWLWALSVFVWVSIVWSLVELFGDRFRARSLDATLVVLIGVVSLANLGFTAHDLGPTTDRQAADTLERTFEDLASFEPGGAIRYDVDDLRPFEAWSSAVQMRLRELGIEFRVDDEGVVRQLGNRRRADGSEVTTIRQIERGRAVRYDGPACVISRASPFEPEVEAEIDARIDAAVDDLVSGRVELRLDGMPDDLARRFEQALEGHAAEAFVLVADGLLPILAAEERIVVSGPGVDAAIESAELIERRVVGTLVLVVDPPVDCAP